ncbi:MAG: thiosulfate oxidation carrier complex protein SoxZ [Candidatus Competibacterales bacterium]
MTNVRIGVPRTAKRGEVLEVRTLIRHPMESGFRRDSRGQAIPRDILKVFTCHYNGVEVFRGEFFPAVAANPYLTFYTKATESGELTFRWVDQRGEAVTETVAIEVS